MKTLEFKDESIPENFYKVLIFKSKIEERKTLLEELHTSLKNRFNGDYSKTMFKALEVPVEDDIVNNYIFITEPDVMKSALAAGNIEATIYCKCLNYTKFLFHEFHKEFKLFAQPKQVNLF